MKVITISFGCLVIVLLANSTYKLRASNTKLVQELEIAESYQRQAQDQATLNTQQRLNFQASISELEESLLSMRAQLANLTSALEIAEERADPDYQELLKKARTEVDSESNTNDQQAAFSMFSNPEVTRKLAEELIASNYIGFATTVNLSPSEGEVVLESITSFYDERYQMLNLLMQGNLTKDQALSYFGPDAMTSNLAFALTTDQQESLRAYNLQSSRNAARTVYSSMLDPSGAISKTDTDPMLKVLLDELYSAQNNFGSLVSTDGSMKSAYKMKLQALDRAQAQLRSEYHESELIQFNQLVQILTGTVDVVLEANEDASGSVNVRNMRISSDSLPN